MAGFENTLGDAWSTVLAIENCQTRKVLFEKCTFFIEIYDGDIFNINTGLKLKVREGEIEELGSDEGLKTHCRVCGFYVVVEGFLKNECVLKGNTVKEFR